MMVGAPWYRLLAVASLCLVFSTLVPTTDAQRCGRCDIELAFVLDASTKSIANDWENMKNFVNSVQTKFDVSQTCVRVAVVRYANTADVSIALATYGDIVSLQSGVQALTIIGSGSNLATALQVLRTQAFSTGVIHPGARLVAGIITDRLSCSTQITSEANTLKDSGVVLFGVAITSTGEVDTTCLRQVVTGEQLIVSASYSQLNNYVNQAVQYACVAPFYNLALGKTARQFSTVLPASNAVDGDVTTMSCTRDDGNRMWWAVDLRQHYYIGRVTITLSNTRDGTVLHALSNFAVGMMSQLPNAGSQVDTSSYTRCGTRNVGVRAGLVVTIDCDPITRQFRVVFVQSLYSNVARLCIAEVAVYARTVATSTTSSTRSTTTTSPPISSITSTTTRSTTKVPSSTSTKTTSSLPFAPRNLQITPRQSTYQPGDRVQCSAEGNPEPSYQWTDLISGDVTQGAVLVITDDMVDESHAFKCVATNYYNETMRENSTTVVFCVTEAVSSNDAYKSATIALAVIAGIAILIIVLLVLYIVCTIIPTSASNHHRQTDGESGQSAAVTETTMNPRSGDAYEELNMTSRTEPMYSQLAR